MKTLKRSLLVACLFLTFTGCQRAALHHNLEEIEADEILAILHQNSIEAKKEKEITGQEVSWTVLVSEKDTPKARQILISNNLPRRRELGLSGVYKDKGLIPTPDEQKARFLLALKGEIINSLQKIPGVIETDVVLNVPTEREFSELDPIKRRPTASVIIRTRNDEMMAQTVTEGKIQRFVANTIPNLDANDVAVIITRTDMGAMPSSVMNPPPPPVSGVPGGEGVPDEVLSPSQGDENLVDLAGMKMDASSVGRFKATLVGLLSLLVGVSGYLLYNIIRLNRLRLKVQKAKPVARTALGVGEGRGFLEQGVAPERQTMEGTFDVGASRRQ